MKIKRRENRFTDLINKGRIGFLLADVVVLSLSLYLAFLLRFDGVIPPRYFSMFLWTLPLVLGGKIPLLILFRTYRFSWDYVGLNELYMTSMACVGGSLAFATALFILRHWPAAVGMPRSILGIDFALTLLGIGGIRLSKRVLQHALKRRREREGKRSLIVGAGDAGSQLVRAILEEQKSGFYPIGFIDDDPRKRGLSIHGVSVLGARNRLPGLIRSGQAEAVIIAMPSVSSHVIRETVDLARKAGVEEIKILPFLSELYSGEVKVSAVREVQPEDLLNREPVHIDTEAIGQFLSEKTVLVTGAAGSIGSELCRQILRFGSKRLIAFDIDETGLFNLEKDLERRFPKSRVQVIVGDVREQEKVARTFHQHQPRVVFHAAAYKHVPLMESFPEEAVKTNVFGTRTVVQEACRSGVEVFVMISTDKAVNPTSVMGATKRVAEMEVLAVGKESEARCMAVRFGNVLGSRGSVIPTFMEQIKRGGPVTVTDPGMLRYFMITAEAVLLVLQAGAMGRGGEVFVLDMGEPVEILSLAKDLIRFHGLEPDRDIPIVFTGIRPGEKLYEELLTAEEGTDATSHQRIFVAKMGATLGQEKHTLALKQLQQGATVSEKSRIIAALRTLVPSYRKKQ